VPEAYLAPAVDSRAGAGRPSRSGGERKPGLLLPTIDSQRQLLAQHDGAAGAAGAAAPCSPFVPAARRARFEGRPMWPRERGDARAGVRSRSVSPSGRAASPDAEALALVLPPLPEASPAQRLLAAISDAPSFDRGVRESQLEVCALRPSQRVLMIRSPKRFCQVFDTRGKKRALASLPSPLPLLHGFPEIRWLQWG
jgi:hypothetical protein